MSKILSGFNQDRLVEYKLGYREALILRWFLQFLGETERTRADVDEGLADSEQMCSKMRYIVHPDTGERYYYISLQYLLEQFPALEITRTATLSNILAHLCGDFSDIKGKDPLKEAVYPLRKFLTSKNGRRELYFRPTSTVDYLTGSTDSRIQGALDKWNKPAERPRQRNLLSDKKILSPEFVEFYHKVEAIHKFGHKLPLPGKDPTKTLLMAQELYDSVLSGNFLVSHKFDQMQDTSMYDNTEEALLRAIERYTTAVKQGHMQYHYTLASFIYNPISKKSMFLSMLMADRFTKNTTLSKTELQEMRESAPLRAQKLLLEAEDRFEMTIDAKAVENTSDLVNWVEENWNALRIMAEEGLKPLNEWGDFKDTLLEWLDTWKEVKASHFKRGNGVWALFVEHCKSECGWILDFNDKQVEARRRQLEARRSLNAASRGGRHIRADDI